MNMDKTSPPLRILLVEDNEHDRLVFRRAFQKSEVSCEITECVSAEKALERVRADASSFDLVVIDHNLPGMSGLDLCKELLDEEIPLPLVLVTGRGSEQLAVEALKAGADDYVVKDRGQGYLDLLPVVLPGVVGRHGDRLARKRAEEALRRAHDELERRVEERTAELANSNVLLKQEITERKRAEESLRQERDRSQTYLDIVGVMLVALNEKGEITLVNRRACQVLGYEEDVLVGRSWFDTCLPAQSQEEVSSIYQRLMAGDADLVEFFENPILTSSEEERIIAWHNTVLTDEAGNITGTLSSGEDVTEQKQTQEALAAERNLLRTLIDNMPDFIYVKDRESRFLVGNVALARLMGAATPDELLERTDSDFYPEELAARYYADDQEVMATGQPLIAHEEPGADSEGTMLWLSTTKAPLRDTAGEIIGMVGIGRDITERVQAEEQVRQSAARAEALARTAGRLNAQLDLDAVLNAVCEEIAHALNVPVANVNLYDDEVDVLVPGAGFGVPPEHRGRLRPIPRAWYDRAVREAGSLIVIPDVQATPDTPMADLDAETNARTLAMASMVRDGQLVGTLTVITLGEVRHFTQDELALLKGLADQAALAISNTRLYGEASRRNRELELLNRVIAASAIGSEPEEILETACRQLALTFDLPHAAAALLNEEKTAAVVAEYRVEGRPSMLQETIPVEDSPSFQYLLEHKAPLAVDDAQSDPRPAPLHDLMRQCGIVSLLILPLVIGDEVIGSLCLGGAEPHRFSPEEISLAASVADQVSGALARIRSKEERRRLEEQYSQAQRMEAVGQLTAGIAHDFNNLLTAINGFAQLIQLRLAPDDPIQEMVGSILESGRRAADLVAQLMAFSRKQTIDPQVVDLNAAVADMDDMLRRVIREDVELKMDLAPDLWPVKVDPVQMEQVVVNLAVNAADAMPDGGKLTIETSNVVLDEDYVADHLGAEPGEHVLLAVSDTGMGMSPEVQAHIFEPFFTTKERGEGTGLGLASVYGVVKQNGGHIRVHSQEGQGTTFKITLPRAEESAELSPRAEGARAMPAGGETILLVEDVLEVRDLARQVLEGQGYTLLEAGDGQQAMALAASHAGPIHLLLTDVIMPGMSGKALSERLVQSHPDVRVLYMSGHTEGTIEHHGVLGAGTAFLQKPFDPWDLARKVRAVLDE